MHSLSDLTPLHTSSLFVRSSSSQAIFERLDEKMQQELPFSVLTREFIAQHGGDDDDVIVEEIANENDDDLDDDEVDDDADVDDIGDVQEDEK